MVTSSSRVLACLLLCAACLGLATPEPLTSTLSLSVYPNPSRRTRLWLEHHRQKEYAPPRSLSKREPVSSEGLFDWGDDASYFVTVLIGSPSQYLNLTLNQQSSALWIPSTPCCSVVTSSTFNPSASSTWVNASVPITLPYNGANVTGWAGVDTVSLANITVSNQTISVIDWSSLAANTSNSFSGVMGFGWANSSQTSSVRLPWWQNIFNDPSVTESVFSLYIARHVINQTETPGIVEAGGSLDIGFTNTSYYTGAITYTSLNTSSNSPMFWQINLQNVTAEGVPILLGNSTVARVSMDSPFIAVPAVIATAIYNLVPGAILDSRDFSGYYRIPCNSSVSISFTISGIIYPINAIDFIIALGNDECLGAVYPSEPGAVPQWTLGDAFLKNVYTVFRATPPAIGFAKLAPAYANRGLGASNSGGSPASTLTSATEAPTSPAFSSLSSAHSMSTTSSAESRFGAPDWQTGIFAWILCTILYDVFQLAT